MITRIKNLLFNRNRYHSHPNAIIFCNFKGNNRCFKSLEHLNVIPISDDFTLRDIKDKISQLPEKYKYIFIMSSPFIVEDKEWIPKCCDLLKTCHIVQPYQWAIYEGNPFMDIIKDLINRFGVGSHYVKKSLAFSLSSEDKMYSDTPCISIIGFNRYTSIFLPNNMSDMIGYPKLSIVGRTVKFLTTSIIKCYG